MKKIIKFLGVIAAVLLARLLPFNWMIGSHCAMFSWSTIFAPVVAVQCGLSWVFFFIVSKQLLTASSLLLFFCHRLPLLFAARAFQKRDFIMSVIVPLICMSLFVTHEVGMSAWVYSLYWLIPIGLYVIQHNSDWSRALTASFVAHGVGSIVCLYTGTLTAAVWLSLLPIVACERLLMATAMVLCNRLCGYVLKIHKNSQRYIPYPKVSK